MAEKQILRAVGVGLELGTAGLPSPIHQSLSHAASLSHAKFSLKVTNNIGPFKGESVNIRYHLGIFSGCPFTVTLGKQRYKTHMVVSYIADCQLTF